MLGKFLQGQIDVKAECGDIVDDVDRRFNEITLIGRRYEPNNNLKREPCVAHTFYVKESVVGIR